MASIGGPPFDDDEDDWFSKDIDDFVVDVKKDPSADQHQQDVDATASALLESLRTNPKQFFDGKSGRLMADLSYFSISKRLHFRCQRKLLRSVRRRRCRRIANEVPPAGREERLRAEDSVFEAAEFVGE